MAADAEGTAAGADSNLPEQLKAGLDKVDLLIGDLGQLGEFTKRAEEFVAEAAKEIWWNKVGRIAAVSATLIIITVLILFLLWALTGGYEDTFAASPNALPVLIGAIVGGVVILTITLTRAVHMTFSERNAGMPMPEHLKAVADAAMTIFPAHR